jgi:hypothetical protein
MDGWKANGDEIGQGEEERRKEEEASQEPRFLSK